MTRQRGYSLVELMVSVALFGLIAASALSIAMSAVRAQSHAARVDVAQSGLRAGLDFLSRDLLSASGGASTANLVDGATGAAITPIVVTNSSTAPDGLELYLIDATTLANVVMPVTPSATSITVDAVTSFNSGDTIQLCNLSAGVLATVSGTGAGGYPTLNVSGLNAFPSSLTAFAPGSYVFKSKHVTYAVDQSNVTATGNEAMLTLDLHDGNGPQPLAEGVEDFQIALGFDGLNGLATDGVLTEVGVGANDDEWVYNVPGETAPVTLANLKAVRVTLVVKSTSSESGTFPARPRAEDHAAGTSDGFFRRVLRTEVTVRNFNL